MSNQSPLPDWVKPGVMAMSNRTVFVIAAARKTRPPQPITMLVAANERTFPAQKCKLATIADLAAASRYLAEDGKSYILALKDGLVEISDGVERRFVRLPQEGVELAAAVASFAQAFDGVIVEGAGDEY